MRRVLLLTASMIALSGPAQSRTMQEKLQAACAVAVATLCPDKAADPDALKACLLTHRSQVSQACMTLIDASE